MPTWSLAELATKQGSTMAAVLSAVAGAAVVTAAAHQDAVTSRRYPDLVRQRAVPDLLSNPTAGSALGQADILGVSARWEDIGLGAITDIVQHTFGLVDLDRSPVELAAAGFHLSCPACAGRRFKFPADLADARDGMCPAHRAEAEAVIKKRLARANASNPDGWGALTDASLRLEQPHLPGGLATRLAGAGEAMYVVPDPEELAMRARLVIEAASWFPGRGRDLTIALGGEPELAGQFPDWLASLVLDLGRAGLGSEAAAVGSALAQVDPGGQAFFDGDIAVALAESGFADEARTRIAANLARWPDDLWIRVHAGDALAALGDREGAEAHFGAALEMAEQANDFAGRSDVVEWLRRIGRPSLQDERGLPVVQRHQSRPRRSRAQREGKRQPGSGTAAAATVRGSGSAATPVRVTHAAPTPRVMTPTAARNIRVFRSSSRVISWQQKAAAEAITSPIFQ
jgi:tetratricopeptide (TPR) repeat protein